MPPSAQAVTRARRLSSRLRRFAAVVTRRAPVAPKGCPSESEPPCVLTLEMSMTPTLASRPGRFSLANASEAMAVKFERTCPAKASCISTTSMSFSSESPFRSSSCDVAYVGPSNNSSNGSTAANVKSTSRALGVKPSSSAFASSMMTHAAAPSVRNDEFAAVCVPSGPLMNAGFSLASCSGVETRMPFSSSGFVAFFGSFDEAGFSPVAGPGTSSSA
mmetsp:Transcript_4236/g.17185  ORF Transcript_4236/g.17185 Transcript_4236/m.17185 type:complete len:218 (+) Transcript_4236:353-1006(+)